MIKQSSQPISRCLLKALSARLEFDMNPDTEKVLSPNKAGYHLGVP